MCLALATHKCLEYYPENGGVEMEPISTLFGILTFLGAHFASDTSVRYEMNCWGTFSWYHCHQENFGNLHTDAYRAALKSGHNIRVAHRHAKKG